MRQEAAAEQAVRRKKELERRKEMQLDRMRVEEERVRMDEVDRRSRDDHESWMRMRGVRSEMLKRSRTERRRLAPQRSRALIEVTHDPN